MTITVTDIKLILTTTITNGMIFDRELSELEVCSVRKIIIVKMVMNNWEQKKLI